MTLSTHKVEVIRITEMSKHPQADTLSIVKVFGGYPCCVKTEDFKVGDLAAYIVPDSIVPNTPQFAFLDGHFRIHVRKYRGFISMGLLIPAPSGSKEGDDVAEQMGITHWEPIIDVEGGDQTLPPPGVHPDYDVDALRRYVDLFQPDEVVHITEKIHGMNIRFTVEDGEMFVGSKGNWKLFNINNKFWRAALKYPQIETFCRAYPGFTVYGELFGHEVYSKFSYGEKNIDVRVYDIRTPTLEWLDIIYARTIGADLPWVPTVAETEYNIDKMEELAEGPTLLNDTHIREGIVIRPYIERQDLRVGRVIAKLPSKTFYGKG